MMKQCGQQGTIINEEANVLVLFLENVRLNYTIQILDLMTFKVVKNYENSGILFNNNNYFITFENDEYKI